jgi:hypothetical protein
VACSTGCRTKTHRTFGECLRAKNLQVADVAAHQTNQSLNKSLDGYRSAREAGLQPDGVYAHQVQRAWSETDRTGEAYRGDEG